MTWFKVDDKFPTSPKVLSIPRSLRLAAVGLWTTAGAWSSSHLQDGFVPGYMIEEWGADERLVKALLAAGLWKTHRDGYRFHDWFDYNPSREAIESRRAADAARKAAARAAKAAKTRERPAGQVAESERSPRNVHGESALPDPTRPDPTREASNDASTPQPPKGGGGRKRPTLPLPSDWEPTPEHVRFAEEHRLDVAFEARQFRAHAEANDRRQASWNAAFTTWLGKSSQRPRPGSGWASPPSRGEARIQRNLAVLDLLDDGPAVKEITR